MLRSLFARPDTGPEGHDFYGAVVARVREPVFYTQAGVPDTFPARFELLVLHLYIINRALLGRQGTEGLRQAIFDSFIEDMDIAMREAGIGDQTVPKRLAKMTKAAHGRARALDAALDGDDDPFAGVSDVVERNLFQDGDAGSHAATIARYLLDQLDELQQRAASERPLSTELPTINLKPSVRTSV